MPGHLFILHGDLKQLSCDAWLMPRDHKKTAGVNWPKGLPLPKGLVFPEGWGEIGKPRTFPALPVVGTGAGGASGIRGAIAAALVGTLLDWVARHDVDVALVCYTPRDFAACQRARADRPFVWRAITM